jgi:hypothetical protein
MSLNIGLVDADLLDNGTRHPNLALMKMSGYYKGKNHEVRLINNYNEISNFDQIFISKVFSFTKINPVINSLKNIGKGGTGFFPEGDKPWLKYEIEHHFPDYHLYDNYIGEMIEKGRKERSFSDFLHYSIGFTTRGCFRKCDFCVNKRYNKVIRHAHVSEFFDQSRYGIYLWDDNFLGYQKWEEVLDELEDTGKPFQFRQGLDIRLLDARKIGRLLKTKYHGDFIFAFDYINEKEIIEKKLTLWRKHTNRTTKLYILCAFESQDEVDIINTFERIKVLMKFGCLPYLMRYENYLNSVHKGLYIQIARV